MNINQAKLYISAVSQKQYPQNNFPEIALAGRSNVGKSSFINCLIRRKSLARTSSKPGKTQTLNFYVLNDSFYFVDVPGYGYAKVSKAERNKWGPMMEEYFETRAQLQLVILITDLRHEPTQEDIQMYRYLKYLDYPVIVMATKADKVKRGKRQAYLNRSKQSIQLQKDDVIIPFSAETGEGKEQAWKEIKRYV
ncbi:MAG TPA: ribosome biogenesis GTP-binding protein YihA/YsxC [Virgibacillus sp.]|nr:ribosome biogenesis GTP-binding protein YihA/YsxC [Virgibacillus sp.]